MGSTEWGTRGSLPWWATKQVGQRRVGGTLHVQKMRARSLRQIWQVWLLESLDDLGAAILLLILQIY